MLPFLANKDEYNNNDGTCFDFFLQPLPHEGNSERVGQCKYSVNYALKYTPITEEKK